MLRAHSASVRGLREENEDEHCIFMNKTKKRQENTNIDFFSLFDGHGGKEVSKYLKDNILKFFINKEVKYPLTKRYVYGTYDKIQNELSKKSYSKEMGSTGHIIVYYEKGLKENWINVLNNGDSRSIICRNNIAIPLSKDHKPNWPEEKCRIEQLGGIVRFDGSDHRIKNLSVSRSFGDRDSAPYVTHRPDIFNYKIEKSDKFIIMACDGLWDVASNSEVVNFVLSNCYDSTLKKRINTNVNMAKMLADFALKKRSSDNVTVIVIFIDSEL